MRYLAAILIAAASMSACGVDDLSKPELDEEEAQSFAAESVTVLSNDARMILSGPRSSMQLFSLEVPASATNLRFAINGGTGDADLYVRFGSAPTTSAYDHRPYLSRSNEEVIPPVTKPGTWFIGVRGYSQYSNVTLSASYRLPGAELILQNGARFTMLSGGRGSELHFKATLPAQASALRIALSGGNGDADLYVRFGSAPTTSAYDHRPYLSSSNETVEIDAPQAGDWFVMVRGFNAYSGATLGASWGNQASSIEDQVLVLINERRAQGASCGGMPRAPAPPLTMNELIRNASRAHSADMAARNFFAHDTPEGRTFDQRMRDAGYNGPSPWGENIAAGQATANDVVDGWMNSPGHCENIMNPAFRVAGVGYVYSAGTTYRHYWTQDFGGGD